MSQPYQCQQPSPDDYDSYYRRTRQTEPPMALAAVPAAKPKAKLSGNMAGWLIIVIMAALITAVVLA